MRPDIPSSLLPTTTHYITPASSSVLASSMWPSAHDMEITTSAAYWKANDWNTLGKYPFSTKIRLGDEVEALQFEPILPFTNIPRYTPTHSRHTSRSISNESDHADDHISPSPLGSSSPTTPYESIPSQAGLVKLSNGQWQCPYCRKQFRRRDRGQAHVNVHINARPYRCDGSCGNPICDRSYFSQESLQSHAQHAMIICDTCGKELRKKNISRHRKRYCTSKPSP